MQLKWSDFKALVVSKGLYIQYVDVAGKYFLRAYDGAFQLSCELDKTPSDTTDLDDFVNNFKNLTTTNLPIQQLDVDGAQIVRNKAAKKGWSFCSLPVEFETARLSDTMFAQDYQGNNRTFFTMKAYDADNVEVTTPGVLNANYATITKTVIDFEPTYDYEIIGGDLRTLTTISSDIRLWIVAVPDIAAPTGSKEMGGGINLRYLSPGNVFSVDGRVSKYATYSATYHTNKLRMIFKYPAGTNESIAVTIQLYKA